MTRARNLANLANVDTFTVDSSDRVGLGTTNPGATLQITADSPGILFEDQNSGYTESKIEGSSGHLFFTTANINRDHIFNATGGSESVRITGDGSVGIGTDNPSTKLQIVGSTNSADSAGGTLGIRQKGDTNNDGITLTSSHANSARFWKDSDGKLHIYNTGTGSNQFVLDNAGRVGIGTDTVSSLLHIRTASAGALMFMLESDLGTNNNRTLTVTSPATDSSTDPYVFNTANSLEFQVDSTNRLHIHSSGQIGIGTDNPGSLVHALGSYGTVRVENDNTAQYASSSIELKGPAGDERSTKIVHGNNNTGGTETYFQIEQLNSSGSYVKTLSTYSYQYDYWAFNAGGPERLRISSTGNVGIGTDNPAEKLSVAGNVRVQNSSNASQYLNISYQGIDFQNTGAGSSTTATSHLLDDYEEGTFTPAITQGITSPSITSVFGHYVKVGTLVMCSIDFRMNGTQTGNGDIFRVGGLPFNSSTDGSIYGSATINFNNILTGFSELRAGHFNEASEITFYNGTNSINGNTAGVNFSDQRRLIMQVIYKST
jgi:hypothetical protein